MARKQTMKELQTEMAALIREDLKRPAKDKTELDVIKLQNELSKIGGKIYQRLKKAEKEKAKQIMEHPEEKGAARRYGEMLTDKLYSKAQRNRFRNGAVLTQKDVSYTINKGAMGMTQEERATRLAAAQLRDEDPIMYESIKRAMKDAGMDARKANSYIRENMRYVKYVDPVTGKKSWSFELDLPQKVVISYRPEGIKYKKSYRRRMR